MFAINIRMKPVTYELDLGSFVDLIQLIKLLSPWLIRAPDEALIVSFKYQ